jgi:hypothetical protein
LKARSSKPRNYVPKLEQLRRYSALGPRMASKNEKSWKVNPELEPLIYKLWHKKRDPDPRGDFLIGVYFDQDNREHTCQQCIQGTSYKKGHKHFCDRSIYYGKTYEEIAEENRRKLLPAPKFGPITNKRATIAAFLAPKKRTKVVPDAVSAPAPAESVAALNGGTTTTAPSENAALSSPPTRMIMMATRLVPYHNPYANLKPPPQPTPAHQQK